MLGLFISFLHYFAFPSRTHTQCSILDFKCRKYSGWHKKNEMLLSSKRHSSLFRILCLLHLWREYQEHRSEQHLHHCSFYLHSNNSVKKILLTCFKRFPSFLFHKSERNISAFEVKSQTKKATEKSHFYQRWKKSIAISVNHKW